MNHAKWTWFAIGYQCVFAYAVAFMINQFGCLFTGHVNTIGFICAVLVLLGMLYLLFRPDRQRTVTRKKVRV